eukprot:TRINITY_DN8055_c0_g1_i1.p1 TRINITY_DN8055_c0_g1~~TRINITY_DN8055_c0_g1_i1.p1  ORF type:complete len:710 (+),score=136.48 TRINITY_DN8055_c0_g1_i1:147-2276(+)
MRSRCKDAYPLPFEELSSPQGSRSKSKAEKDGLLTALSASGLLPMQSSVKDASLLSPLGLSPLSASGGSGISLRSTSKGSDTLLSPIAVTSGWNSTKESLLSPLSQGAKIVSKSELTRSASKGELTRSSMKGELPDTKKKVRAKNHMGLVSKSKSLPALRRGGACRRSAWLPGTECFQELTDGISVVEHLKRIPVESRGIMIGQLYRLIDFVKSHCKPQYADAPLEGWFDSQTGDQLTLRRINHSQLRDCVINPMTSAAKCSYVEAIAFSVSHQMPSWFVSHWWGMPILESVISLKAHACLRHPEGSRDLTTATGYWICTFALSQQDLDEPLPPEPKRFSFYKALLVCQGTVLLLDDGRPGEGSSEVFRRTWCIFEVSMSTFSLNHLMLDIVTRDAAGEVRILTEDLPTKEKYMDAYLAGLARESPWQESGRTLRLQREELFPVRALMPATEVSLVHQSEAANQGKDRIMKAIVGHDLDEEQDKFRQLDLGHPMFRALDMRVRSKLSLMALRTAIQQRIDISEYGEMPLVRAIREDTLQKELHVDLTSCWQLDDMDLKAVASCIPQSGKLRRLSFNFSGCHRLTDVSALMIAANLSGVKDLRIDFSNCTGLGKDKGNRLFGDFGNRCSAREELEALDVNFLGCHSLVDSVEELAEMLKGIPHIKTLRILSPSCVDLGMKTSDKKAHGFQPKATPKAKWQSPTAQMFFKR